MAPWRTAGSRAPTCRTTRVQKSECTLPEMTGATTLWKKSRERCSGPETLTRGDDEARTSAVDDGPVLASTHLMSRPRFSVT